jgi:hypothetical protein
MEYILLRKRIEVAGSCGHRTEISGSEKIEELSDSLSYYKLLKTLLKGIIL